MNDIYVTLRLILPMPAAKAIVRELLAIARESVRYGFFDESPGDLLDDSRVMNPHSWIQRDFTGMATTIRDMLYTIVPRKVSRPKFKCDCITAEQMSQCRAFDLPRTPRKLRTEDLRQYGVVDQPTRKQLSRDKRFKRR